MNGVQLLETVRSRWPQTMRVLCTGFYGSDVVIAAVNRGGVDKVICKPFEPQQLIEDLQEVINEYLTRSSARDAVESPGRGRVLVVDDEPCVVRALTRLLGHEHEVIGTTSSTEALALLGQDSNFDAVLCDLQMPQMDGRELHGQILKRHPQLAERVVFVTGGGSEAQTFLDNVPNLRVAKPFPITELRRIIAILTRGSSPSHKTVNGRPVGRTGGADNGSPVGRVGGADN